MKKIQLTLITLLVGVSPLFAQVEDINFILAPKAGYDFMDKKTTSDNLFYYGAEAGFGFGKVIELRGFYQQSIKGKQQFDKYQSDFNSFAGDDAYDLSSHSLSMTRVGGELKANIQIGNYSPYVLLGLGAETFEVNFPDEKIKNQHLFGQIGVGLKLNITPRITWDIDARITAYNMNPSNMFYHETDDLVDDWRHTLENKTMLNWGINTGFSFYLGGTNTATMDEAEIMNYEYFKNRLSNIKFTLSPYITFFNFNENSIYRNTPALGGKLGIDFSDYLGIELYYSQGTQENVKGFDKLSVFGGDLVGRLNAPRGIVPYITIGGGAIYNGDNYVGKEIQGAPAWAYTYHKQTVGFAKGGLGIEIPIADFMTIYGAANILFTIENEDQNIQNINAAEQLQQHSSFDVGVRFKIGKKHKVKKDDTSLSDLKIEKDEKEIYLEKSEQLENRFKNAFRNNDQEDMDYILQKKKELDARYYKVSDEKKEKAYQQNLNILEKELEEAFEENDREKIQQLIEEKRMLDMDFYNLHSKNEKEDAKESKKYIRLTPDELQQLIDGTIDRVIEEEEGKYYEHNTEKRLDKIEKMLEKVIQERQESEE